MPTVAIEPTLYQRVEQAALESQVSTGEMLTQALRRYLWELDRRKITEESKVYRRRHAELKERYLGQYIAMHEGQVVDHDPDFQTLRQRVRQQFGRTAVMIALVEEAAEPELIRRGFRLGRNVLNRLHVALDGPTQMTEVR